MAFVCKTINETSNSCIEWVEQLTWVDQLSITRSDAFMLLTPIVSIYVLLIGWHVFMLIYHNR